MDICINLLEINILWSIREWLESGFMDRVMVFVTTLGNRGFFWIAASLLLLVEKKNRKTGLMVLAVLAVTAVLGEGIFKPLIMRPRPYEFYPSMELLLPEPETYAFPSGHTAFSAGAASILGARLGRPGKLFWVPALLIAFSRMYLFLHYPSDVLGGVLLGITCAAVVRASWAPAANYFRKKKNSW